MSRETTLQAHGPLMAGASRATMLLESYDVSVLEDGFRRMGEIGAAISAVGKVVDTLHTLAGCAPCATCGDLHEQLSNGYVLGGLNTAMAELGDKVATLAERMQDILEGAEVVRGASVDDTVN